MPRHTLDEAATIRSLAKEISSLAAVDGENGIEQLVDSLNFDELVLRQKTIQYNLERIFSATKVRMTHVIAPDIPLSLRACCLYADAIQDEKNPSDEYLSIVKCIWAQSQEAVHWEKYGSNKQKLINFYHHLRITYFNILIRFQQMGF